jgi:hypothetical protein
MFYATVKRNFLQNFLKKIVNATIDATLTIIFFNHLFESVVDL